MNKNYLTKITLGVGILFLLTACETGMRNKKAVNDEAPSGIVDKDTEYVDESSIIEHPSSSSYKSNYSNSKAKTARIFSNSATPGFYVQVGFFGNYKPNKAFMTKLDRSGLPYTVLLKNDDYRALIGPYKSLKSAKSKLASTRKIAAKGFIVEVLRP